MSLLNQKRKFRFESFYLGNKDLSLPTWYRRHLYCIDLMGLFSFNVMNCFECVTPVVNFFILKFRIFFFLIERKQISQVILLATITQIAGFGPIAIRRRCKYCTYNSSSNKYENRQGSRVTCHMYNCENYNRYR